jgi:hypothetical protein
MTRRSRRRNNLRFDVNHIIFCRREEVPEKGFGLPFARVLELYPHVHAPRARQRGIKPVKMIGGAGIDRPSQLKRSR